MARCRVCHRELHNAAHIAAGVGPICAQRAARFSVGTGRSEQASYPAERLARIERNVARCWETVCRVQRYQMAARMSGTAEQVAWGDWAEALAIRWYERWSAIQRLASVRAA